MSDLLKEAIADAKAVRETALQNAKAALEEAFTPQLKSMLSAKLQEDEMGEGMYEDEEEMEDEESAEDMEDEMPSDEVPVDDMPADEPMDDVDGDMVPDEDDEEVEEVLGAGAGALGGLAAAEMGGVSPVIAVPVGAMTGDLLFPGDTNESVSSGNLDLDSVIAELEEEIDADSVSTQPLAEEAPQHQVPVQQEVEEEYEIDEADLDEGEELTAEDIENLYNIADNSMNELAEYKQAVGFLKERLSEVNILNAKLLYTNKLFKEYSLDNNQKLKVVENFDRAQTTREIKLVYSTIAEQLNENTGVPKRKSIKESASAAVSSTKPSQKSRKVITEEDEVAQRFKKLAGLIKG